jgi:hypothetical protein
VSLTIRTGKPGRPRKVEFSEAHAPLLAEITAADAVVLDCVRAHAAEPTQAHVVEMLAAQMRVAALRAHLARSIGADAAHKSETELVVKLSGARDDAAKSLWVDELKGLHLLVTARRGVHEAIARELAAEAEGDVPPECERFAP